MNKLTLRCSMLGLFATALAVGCSGTDAADGHTGAAAAAITTVGAPIINGCSVSQVFDITSPFNQSIDFVAIQAQNLNDLQLQLFSVDASGNQTAMSQSSHTITADMQQMLALSESSSSSLSNATSASAQNSSNAVTSAQAQNSASNSSSAQNSANLAEDDSTTVSHMVHQDANASNSSSAVNNAALLSLLGIPPSIALANQNFFNKNKSASESNLQTQDTTQHQQNLVASNQASADNQSANDSSSGATQNLSNDSSQQAGNSTDAQASHDLNQNINASSSASDDASASSNQAFTNMLQQQLQHVRVLVNSVASAQHASTSVFTGANQSVFANGAFPVTLSACDPGIATPTVVTTP